MAKKGTKSEKGKTDRKAPEGTQEEQGIDDVDSRVKEAYDTALLALDRIKEKKKSIEDKYEALKREELEPLEQEQQGFEKRLESLAPILGKSFRPRRKQKTRSTPRIRTEDLWRDVREILSNGEDWAVKDIFLELYKRDYQPSNSTRSRAYAALSSWVKEGKLGKSGRGIYRLA